MPKSPEFTPAEIQRIRALWDGGATARQLGQAYSRAAETMARIGRRETYTHVPEGEGVQAPLPSTLVGPSEEDAAASLERLLGELKES